MLVSFDCNWGSNAQDSKPGQFNAFVVNDDFYGSCVLSLNLRFL